MEMEELDLCEMFSYFLKKIHIIFISIILFLIGGLCYTLFIKVPMYSSDVTVILASKENKQSSVLQNEIIANQKLAATYRELVGSRRVLKQVITNLDLNYSVNALKQMISVENVNDTEIIKIKVSSKDAKEAKKIANETAEIFQKEIIKIYNLENISIIDKAETSEVPYNVNIIKDIIIYIVLGLFISCSLIFIVYYFDNSVKSVEQVEKHLGIPVIGTVPKVGRKEK